MKDYLKEEETRRINFRILDRKLKGILSLDSISFPSFFVLKCKHRNKLRNYCSQKKIYLPVHWPNPNQLPNDLYDQIISIPVDSRYNESDMERVGDCIRSFFKENL